MTIETSASIENLAAALGKFQAETHGVVRDATNPFLKNRYATLEAVIETARPALAKNGLAFLQAPAGLAHPVPNAVGLETLLMHGASGEWIRFTTAMPLTKTDPQGVGSAITYACRYALMAMLGLPPLDDDAEATKPQQKIAAGGSARSDWGPPQTLSTKDYDTSGKRDYIEGPPVDAAGYQGVVNKKASKQIYIENAIKRMSEMESAPRLLKWATDERKMVWPQYGIDPHDDDGQRLVKAYKERMAVLDELAEDPE